VTVVPPGDGLVLRRADASEDAAIRRLNDAAFPDNPKTRADIVRWQWWDNPFGETLVWVWEDDGEVIAQYVAFCMPGLIGGRPCTLTNGVDAAVDPRYQGRGLFKPLSRALYDDCVAHDSPLLAYVSNPIAVRGISGAGWQEVARLRVLVLPLDDGWLGRRFHLPRPLAAAARHTAFRQRSAGGLRAAVVDAPPDDIDTLWAAVAPRIPNGVARHGEWWRWRYAGHPDQPYRYLEVRRGGRLEAAAVTLPREDFGGRFHYVLELLATDDAAARAIVAAVANGEVGPADGVALTAVPGSEHERTALAAGFRRLPVRLEPKPLHFGVVPHPTLAPAPASLQWSTSWGDLDHI
jgi:predicted N-acetyltransferase YhbS